MKRLQMVAMATLIGLGGVAQAADNMLESATQHGCFICHSIQAKTGPAIPLAPAYADIAARFKDKEFAADYLAKRIVNGTVDTPQDWSGKVNMRFMPPNVSISLEEATRLAEWILSIEKEKISEAVVSREGMLTLAAQNGCMACHGVSKQQDSHYMPLAPTFHDVAARYKGTENAKQTLLASILNGTINQEKKWPDTNMRFMPPNPILNQQDAETLVDWILTQ